jgi:hypothetical protein
MRKTLALAAAGALLSLAAPAFAAGDGSKPTITFHATGNGSAGWLRTSDSDGDGWAVNLVVPDTSSSATIDLGIESRRRLPPSEPSYWLKGTGSPLVGPPWHDSVALTIQLSDGGYAVLQPEQWFNAWQQVKGTWISNGGAGTFNGSPCGTLYDVPYSAVLACHGKASITAAAITSLPLLGTGTNLLIDDIHLRVTFTMPGRSRGGDA